MAPPRKRELKMRLAFLIDPPASLNAKKDSSVALMRAAARDGDEVFILEKSGIIAEPGGLSLVVRRAAVSENDSEWLSTSEAEKLPSGFFGAILLRLDPPLDSAFLHATLALELSDSPVFNAPQALREMNEKLSILNFPELIPPTIATANAGAILAFHKMHGGAVLKPLDGMGGRGVYISPENDRNLRGMLDLLGDDGRAALTAQAYVPEARAGDKRVFVIGGKPAQWMLARVPREDDHRGNMAAGGRPEAKPLGEAERKIAEHVAPTLEKAGIVFAGLDVLGGQLTEINITCPTGLRETLDQTGDDLAAEILREIRKRAD